MRKVLRTLSTEPNTSDVINITHSRSLSSISWINKSLLAVQSHTPFIQKLDLYLQQAAAPLPLTVYVFASIIISCLGFICSLLLTKNIIFQIIIAGGAGSIVPFSIFLKRKRRMSTFERQLPDALDMITRALKAGHALSSGMQMVANEFEDPIGGEFDITIKQVNYGISLHDALKNLSKRIDSKDLPFFTLAVLIQKQYGGNLSEVLENISYLVRERFKLRGRIKTLAAEGVYSCIFLCCLPFLITLIIYVVSKEYIIVLLTDPLGKILITFASVMMALGILVMKKMISIKV
ncbi:MAG: type II secretion system F family protein [bacterium]